MNSAAQPDGNAWPHVRPAGGAVGVVETWLASTSGDLWAAVHRPASGTANGVAVIAGSVGLEALTMHRSAVRLAHELATRGVMAVRFAWSGDGDSAPLDDSADPAAVWQTDLAAVVEAARDLAPGLPLHLVAMRLGTTIDPLRPVDTVTHLAPISGRAWIRAHHMLRKLGTPVDVLPTDLGVEVNGRVWTPQQAASIRALRPRPLVGEVTPRTVEVPAEQTDDFFAVAPQMARVPLRPLVEVAEALVRPDSRELPPFSPRTSTTRVVAGEEIVEELVTISSLQLPAVVARRADETPVRNVVVLVAPGAEPRSAPIGLFAEVARSVAAEGSVSVRVDRSGLGELASTRELHAPNVYSEAAVDETVEAIRSAQELAPGRPIVAAGSCVGAWLFLKSAPRVHIDRVVAFEALAWDADANAFAFIPGTIEVAYGGRKFAADLRTPPSMADATRSRRVALAAFGVAKRIAARALALFVRHCPAWLWRPLAARRLVQDPLPLLLGVPLETDIELHFGEFGAAAFERFRGIRSVAEARRRGRSVTMHRWRQFDHSIFAITARQRAERVVLDAARRTV